MAKATTTSDAPKATPDTIKQVQEAAKEERRKKYCCIRGSSMLNSLSGTEAFKMSIVRYNLCCCTYSRAHVVIAAMAHTYSKYIVPVADKLYMPEISPQCMCLLPFECTGWTKGQEVRKQTWCANKLQQHQVHLLSAGSTLQKGYAISLSRLIPTTMASSMLWTSERSCTTAAPGLRK